MYGTVAKFRIKQGKEQALREMFDDQTANIPGMVFGYTYRSDRDPQEFYIAVGFESREAYRKNAESPEQHQMYVKYRELLETEPEWHDGEIVQAQTGAMATS